MNSARENHRIFGSSPPPTQQPHACVWPALRQLLDKTQKPSVKTRRPLARPTRWRQRPPPPPALSLTLRLPGCGAPPPPRPEQGTGLNQGVPALAPEARPGQAPSPPSPAGQAGLTAPPPAGRPERGRRLPALRRHLAAAGLA